MDWGLYPREREGDYRSEYPKRLESDWPLAFEPNPSPREASAGSASTTSSAQEQALHPLDLSLLQSSPPDGTELREANALWHSELDKEQPLLSPVKRYAKRMTRALETCQSENALLRKRLADAESLLQARKQRKKGKRIALQGKFVFSTQEVLDIAKQAELEAAQKKPKKNAKQQAKATLIEDI